MNNNNAYWREKPLSELNQQEWEALCDGCGRCCVHKFEDEDTGELAYSNIACKLLDTATCRCTQYPQRQQQVPDCIQVTPAMLADDQQRQWLPFSCAYRRLAEGDDLPAWHPLVSGSTTAIVNAGISMRGQLISEQDAGDFD